MQVEINRKQHALLQTFCDVTGRKMPEVVEEIIFQWSNTKGLREMQGVIRSSAFLRSASADMKQMKKGVTAKIIVMPSRSDSRYRGIMK